MRSLKLRCCFRCLVPRTYSVLRTSSGVTMTVAHRSFSSESHDTHHHHQRGSQESTTTTDHTAWEGLHRRQYRTTSEADNGSSSGGADHSERAHASPHEQFQQQQSQYYKHSFHTQRTARHEGHNRSEDDTAGPDLPTGSGTRTAKERREITKHWEKAFYGRVHYEEGMHEGYAEASQADEEDRELTGKSNRELFPDWREGESAPRHEFLRLRPALQRRYILNRLAMGERRVRYAAYSGSFLMMAQLSLGESMMREAEELLKELGWMNRELAERIEKVRQDLIEIKFENDLD